MGDDIVYRAPKTKPHDEEEDFDYRTLEEDEEDLSDVFVIYRDENIEQNIKDYLINELGFKFNGEFWESHYSVTKEEIAELEFDDIIVHKI